MPLVLSALRPIPRGSLRGCNGRAIVRCSAYPALKEWAVACAALGDGGQTVRLAAMLELQMLLGCLMSTYCGPRAQTTALYDSHQTCISRERFPKGFAPGPPVKCGGAVNLFLHTGTLRTICSQHSQRGVKLCTPLIRFDTCIPRCSYAKVV